MSKITHPGTSSIYQLIPLETYLELQRRFPILKRLKREA